MVRKTYVSLTKKKVIFGRDTILFQGQKTKQKRRDLAKIFRSKVLGTRPPSAIAVCLSVMMVVWECCTRRNRWQGHIYHWKVGLKSTKPHTFFICDVVVGGCAVYYIVSVCATIFSVCNLEICGFLEDIQHLQVDRGTCDMKNRFSSQNLLNLLNSQRDKWNRVQALMLWNLLKGGQGFGGLKYHTECSIQHQKELQNDMVSELRSGCCVVVRPIFWKEF